MNLSWPDAIGGVGVVMMLGAYLALQLGRLRSEDLAYSVWNGLGAALIVFSLCFAFNLSAMIVEGAWVLISLVGIVRWFRARRHHPRGSRSPG